MVSILIINLIIVFILFTFFLLVGDKIKSYLNKLEFIDSIVLGFIGVLSVFELISLPFILSHSSFSVFYVLMMLLFILFTGYLAFDLGIKSTIFRIRNYYFDMDKIPCYIFVFILSVATFFIAGSVSDSWLYTPMVLSSIDKDQIYYVSSQTHILDAFYLFVSLIINTTLGRNYFELILVYGLIENVLFVLALDSFNRRYFKENRNLIMIMQLLAVFGGITFFLPHYGFRDTFTHLFRVPASGTLFLYVITIPLLFEYIYAKRKSLIYLFIIVMSGFSFSSSASYILFVFAFLYFVFNYYFKSLDQRGLRVIMHTAVYALTYLVFININTHMNMLYLVLTLMIVAFAIYIVNNIKFDVDKVQKVFATLVFAFVILIPVLYFTIFNPHFSNLYTLFHTSPYDRYVSFPEFFPNFYMNPLYIIVLFAGFYSVYKQNDKELMFLPIASIIVFGNGISYVVLGEFVGLAVYHRVFMFASLNIIFIFGFLYILDLIRYKYKNIIVSVFVLLISISTMFNSSIAGSLVPYTFTNSFYYSKLGFKEIEQMKPGLFEEGSKVYVDLSLYTNNITKYFQFDYNARPTTNPYEADYILVLKGSRNHDIMKYDTPIWETSHYEVYEMNKLSDYFIEKLR